MANRRDENDNSIDFQQTIKGVIAVFITILIVVIVVMLFARSLFVTDSKNAAKVKTGHLTSTEYVSVATTAGEEEVQATTTKKKKKKTTTTEEEVSAPSNLPEGLDESVAGNYVVNSAVYLHPEANSSSENLATLPQGAQVEVFGQVYGWYYLIYEGQYGYAYGSFFNPS